MERFAEWLMSSGMILNDNIIWISFHGAYDFAYLLKILTNFPLPDNEPVFLEQVAVYFPTFYDVRYLVKKDNFRGSLSKLAQGLEINRIGSQHQAGSDSIVTSEIFFRLRNFNDFDDIFIKGKNVLFGLGFGDDNEVINFNQSYFASSTVNNVMNNVHNINPTTYQKNIYNNNYPMDNNSFVNQMNPQMYNNLSMMNPMNRTNNYMSNYNGYMPNTVMQGGYEFSQNFK